MPQFTLKSLLLLFAVVAVWLSTFAMGQMASDIRYLVIYTIFLIAGLKAFCQRWRQQVFWLAFFATMVLFLFNAQTNNPAHMRWGQFFYRFIKRPPPTGVYSLLDTGIMASFGLCILLACATVMGFIGMRIYLQSKKGNDR